MMQTLRSYSPQTGCRLPALILAGAMAAALGAGSPEPAAEELKLTVGKSIVLDRPADVVRVSISNPEVVDAVAVTSREILVNAKSQGFSSLVIWSRSGERIFYAVSVEQNLEPIRTLLKETFPGEAMDVRATRDALSLIGRVSAPAVAERATALLAPLSKAVVNNLQVVPPGTEKQIVLRVKFAELNRSIATSFGLNLLSTGAGNTPGRITTGQFPSGNPSELRGQIPGRVAGTASSFSLSDVLNVFAFRPDLNLAAVLRDLQTQGLLQILAEPNLVTTNGKEASFLVGGEFPVPVLQGGANAGSITVQFREFGIRLTFLPQVTPHKTIKMYVKPEVSTIDIANGVVFSGFAIPALATRRMETNIELGEGQSFVVGGLLDDRVTENLMKLPGLSHIPILGALFKSKAQNKTKTELLVLVTPESTYPLLPTDRPPMPPMPQEFLPRETPKAPAQVPKTTPGSPPPREAAKNLPSAKPQAGPGGR